jgi:hypothetical protein
MGAKRNRSSAANLWNEPEVPHKGWTEVGQIDMREQGARDASEYATCGMCGQAGVRHVHEIRHVAYGRTLRVGRICAGSLTKDYTSNPVALADLGPIGNRQ